MIKSQEQKEKETSYAPLFSDKFEKVETNYYYELERHFFIPLIQESERTKKYIELLKKQKQPMAGLKRIFSEFLLEYGLEHIQIKQTKKKSYSSYYDSRKKIVYINEKDFQNFKNNPSDKYAFYLIFIFFHEMAHAYVLSYCNDFSYHDAFYFKIVTEFYTWLSGVSYEEFTQTKKLTPFARAQGLKENLVERLDRTRFQFLNNSFLKRVSFDNLEDSISYLNNEIESFENYKRENATANFVSLEMLTPVFAIDLFKGNDTIVGVHCYIYEFNNKFNLFMVDLNLFHSLAIEKEENYLYKT